MKLIILLALQIVVPINRYFVTHCSNLTHQYKHYKLNYGVQLRKHLFENYSPSIRPVLDQDTITNVTFNMKMIRLLSVDEKHQKLVCLAYYSMKWKNEFLRWNPAEWGNVKYLPAEPETVWLPDIILKNNAASDSETVQKNTDQVWIKHTGQNSWYPKVVLISSFTADVANFPFDNQEFTFHFGSWSLGEEKLRIQKDKKPMLDRHYLNDIEWDLISSRKETIRTAYDSDAYIEIKFIYSVSRKLTYMVITTVIPSVGLMSLALFSYLLPPHNSERLKVMITTLLAFTVFLVEINLHLPRNSDSLPTIQLFYMVTMGECMLCFVATLFLVRLLDRGSDNTLPFYVPIWVRRYVFRMKENQISPSARNQRRPYWKDGIYQLLHLTDSNPVPCDIKKYRKEPSDNRIDLRTKMSVHFAEPVGRHFSARIQSSGNESNVIHQQIVRKVISQSKNPSSSQQIGKMTWGILVKQIDKLCLRLFLTLFIMTSIGILLPAYLSRKNA